MSPEQFSMLPVWYVVFLLSITCHEGAHAWAAYRGGDSTAYLGGQVSLNPTPHVQREMVGTVLVPLLSYIFFALSDPSGGGWMMGWASAPYDPNWEDRHPRRAALMAAAGPAANLILALLAFGVLKAGLAAGIWLPSTGEYYEFGHLVDRSPGSAIWLDGLARFLSVMLSLNFLLFLFNLIPFPPMDGASVIGGLSERARGLLDRIRAIPMAGLIVLIVAWNFFPMFIWVLYKPIIDFLWA